MKTDAPEFSRMLEQLGSAEDPETSMVFRLRSPSGGNLPTSGETKQISSALVERAAHASSHQPVRMQVLENLGSMVVKGHPRLLKCLAQQPEIYEASLSGAKKESSAMIHPARKGPATAGGWVSKDA